MYVLDTDHCVELLRGNESVLSKLKSLDEDIEIGLYTTTIIMNASPISV
jgi:predicted nucleic acid-binding protein